MSKKTAILSLGYWFSATTLGMMTHPYKTLREVVRRKALWWSVLTPVVWGSVFWVGAVMLILMARFVSGVTGILYGNWLYLLAEVVFWWAMWFLGLWQMLVGYLFFRFRRVFGE